MKKIYIFCFFCFFAFIPPLLARNLESSWVIDVEATITYQIEKAPDSVSKITPEERVVFNKFLATMFKDITVTIKNKEQLVTITGPKVKKEYPFIIKEQTENKTILTADNGAITLTIDEKNNTLLFVNTHKETEGFIFTKK